MINVYPGKVLDNNDLRLLIRDSQGEPVESTSVQFKITDKIDPLNPVIRQELTSARRVAKGFYIAPYTMPEDALAGAWEIEWIWDLNGTPQSVFQSFNVVTFSGSPDASLYISPEELYAEGLPRQFGASWVIERILFVQRYMEKLTEHHFLPRYETFFMDGEDVDLLPLPAPILKIEKISIADSLDNYVSEPLRNFAIYDSHHERDRNNPRIKISGSSNSIFNRSAGVFPEGTRNIKIEGYFGYCEEDWTTPLPIKMACKMLVNGWINPLFSRKGETSRYKKAMLSETTDGHSVSFDKSLKSGQLTGDGEIDAILIQYSKGGRVTMT